MERPVGIFDSGIGGLTVLRELRDSISGEQYLYFGDTGRVPYGNKGKLTVTRYSVEIANYLLMNHDIKALVVACNTASSLAVEGLQKLYRIPVFEVVSPAVAKAVAETKNGRIGVIGTSSTIRSNTYKRMIRSQNKHIKVFQKACPLFVPLVEEGWVDHPVTEMVVLEYLSFLKKNRVDTLILGCTHYPFIRSRVEAYLGEGVTIIDSAMNVVIEVEKYLRSHDLVRIGKKKDIRYLVTDDPDKFREHGERLLGERPIDVVQVTL
ncbi:MAG: glutamate racemase [Deltaproteobacteria bacterium]|nr:glutamate racemase [Deltaproteobacteria bacterium]NIS76674.1 glutamate racemase [Deltaproteobacteria bacterium]